MTNKIITYRLPIIIISIVITLLSFLVYPRLDINPNLEDYVPDDLNNKVLMKQLDSLFGGSEMILLLFHGDDVVNKQSLNRMDSIATAIGKLEGIDRCVTPFDATELSVKDGFMATDYLFDSLTDSTDTDVLKQRIRNNSMANKLFSDDFSVGSIIVTKHSAAPDTIIKSIKSVIASYPGKEDVTMGGLPFIRYSITGNIVDDLIYLLPLALFLMVFMLYFSFREWKGVFLPFIIVVMSIILSFGILAFLRWQISLLTVIMPIMLIAIANDYGIHLIARYQELNRVENPMSMKDISRIIVKDLKRPIIITGLTTIGGVLGLLSHSMIPAAQLGILTAIGIAFALVLSLLFLPAVLSYMKQISYTPKTIKQKISPADRWLQRFSKWVVNRPARIAIIAGLFSLVGVAGIVFIKVDTNIEGYFLGDSEVRKSTDLINEKFGGSQFISIVFEGDVLDPAFLQRLEQYEAQIDTLQAVGYVSSPVTLIKELSKGFYIPSEKGYNEIPDSEDEIYQFLEIFAMGGNEETMEQFIDYNYKHARMLISLKDGSNTAAKHVYKTLQLITANDPNFGFIAGPCLTKMELADLVVEGQISSLIFAMVVVFILLTLIFRSVQAGLLSAFPLSIAILSLFGLMGFLGIALDVATALLSSIMIGVGIDYTIHFLWRFKEELARTLNFRESVHITLSTTGRGIIFNAVSVIVGFAALAFSNFAPLRFFSLLVVISISTCLISALLLIPSIILLIKPKFLRKLK